ncbi:MAG: ABC transporter permease [Gemmatimonadaceae bacterium]
MSFRAVFALMRAGWRTALSYRLRFLQAVVGASLAVVPLFFVARALQPTMAKTVANEGGDFFAFLVVGFVVLSMVGACVDLLPTQVGSDIGNGFFEALLGVPAGTPSVLLGLVSYPLAFTFARGCIMIVVAGALGAHFAFARLPEVVIIVTLLTIAHLGIGFLATAAVVAFRTSFNLPQYVMMASGFLGGVYWPTSVLPSWIYRVSEALPMSYGLRAIRHAALEGRQFPAIADDVLTLAAYGGFLLTTGALSLMLALSYARRRGTLSQY